MDAMDTIPLSELKLGMVLARPARDRNGRLLVAEGLTVTEDHLRVLKSWGVTEVAVEGDDSEAVEEEPLPAEALRLSGRYVKIQYRRTDFSDELTREMMRLSSRRLARRITENEQLGEVLREVLDQNVEPEPCEVPERTSSLDPYRVVGDNTELATLPTVFAQLVDSINDPRSSAATIARVVSQDTSLSARLLKIVNSPFYGFPQKIDTISRAVTILGSRQLTMLAMGIAAIDIFKDIPDDICDMESFWQHCIAVGVIARLLASHCNIPNTERLFVAGLLHDIGHLLLYKHIPEEAKQAVLLARCKEEVLFWAERKVLGFDHAKLGGILLKQWKLPPTLEASVAHHHDPSKAMDPKEPSLVCLANSMAYGLDLGSAGEQLVPPPCEDILKNTGLSLSALDSVVGQVDLHYDELTQMFLT